MDPNSLYKWLEYQCQSQVAIEPPKSIIMNTQKNKVYIRTTRGHQGERWDIYVRLRMGSTQEETEIISIRNYKDFITEKEMNEQIEERIRKERKLVTKGMTHLKYIER